MTVAAGFRYEAWLVMAPFFTVIFLRKNYKHAILFGLFAILFPLVWMARGNNRGFGIWI